MPQRNSGEHRPEEACPGERPDADQEAVDHQVDEQVGAEVALLLESGHGALPRVLTSLGQLLVGHADHLPAQPSTGRAAPHEDNGLPFPGPWAAGPRGLGPIRGRHCHLPVEQRSDHRKPAPTGSGPGGQPAAAIGHIRSRSSGDACPSRGAGCNQVRASGDKATMRCHRCRLLKQLSVGLGTRYRAKAQVPGVVVWRAR